MSHYCDTISWAGVRESVGEDESCLGHLLRPLVIVASAHNLGGLGHPAEQEALGGDILTGAVNLSCVIQFRTVGRQGHCGNLVNLKRHLRKWKIVCCINWLWTHHKLEVDAVLFRDGGHLVCWAWQLGHIISFDACAGFCYCVIAGVFVFVIKAACLYTLCFMHKMFWDVCHLH